MEIIQLLLGDFSIQDAQKLTFCATLNVVPLFRQ